MENSNLCGGQKGLPLKTVCCKLQNGDMYLQYYVVSSFCRSLVQQKKTEKELYETAKTEENKISHFQGNLVLFLKKNLFAANLIPFQLNFRSDAFDVVPEAKLGNQARVFPFVVTFKK